ncbi:CoB--CoM heterodisulfide reductase subunit B [Methanosarcina sp. WWM596]|nr:CoB--CoM heterodisulfide reductase subunit B [Methanosarcina sp. WWM596]AKB21219.1 CoB--CoM heterodisulfide reductase subunit B [Methanosarcina sp. WH1]
MGFSQIHLNKNTSLQVTKAKLDSLQPYFRIFMRINVA